MLQMVLIRRLLLVFLVLFLGSCIQEEEAKGPEIIELKADPESVLAGDVSTISFRVKPNNESTVFEWSAAMPTATAAGATLDVIQGSVEPNGQVIIHFQSKDPTTGDGAVILLTAVDTNLLPSQNQDPVHALRIKVLARTP